MARILLVDDDELLRGTLRQMLALDGHQVIEADDGRSALALVQGGAAPDLIVTDILMPGMDGSQLIVALKAVLPRCKVIAMSGGRRSLSPQFSLDTAVIAGASQSLAKPFGRAALQATVQQALAT